MSALLAMNKVEFSQSFTDSGYLRTFEAEIDCLAENELFIRGEMRDQRFAIEHEWRLRTPSYEVIEASARQISGDLEQRLSQNYSGIRGVRIGRGFSRRVLEVLGDGWGREEHLFLAIEMARVGQQVYQFPPELEAQFQPKSADVTEVARVAWMKDRAYMADLANSCHTYRDESAELFDSREIRCGFGSELTRPRPAQRRVFWRRKRIAIQKVNGDAYHCESAMEDNIHDIRVEFEIGSDGVIGPAASRGLRLPYHGLCEDAQLRTQGLEGLQVTGDYVRQFADRVGGRTGCTHLFDLSIDCLRLFRFE